MKHARQRLIKESPLGANLVLTELHLPLHRLLDEHRKDEMYGGRSWEDVHAELAERLDAVFAAAAWTVFAFTYRKVEPTRVMIEPVGLETKRALEAFREAVYTQTGLRCISAPFYKADLSGTVVLKTTMVVPACT